MTFANPIVTKALGCGLRLADSPLFSPLNEIARSFYSARLTPWLERRLRLAIGLPLLRLVVRNSCARAGDGFNIFGSDIDYAAVVSQEEAHSLARCYAIYDKLRAHIPFLGEIELYTQNEWALRMEACLDPFVRLVGSIRKIAWEKEKLASANTEYHRMKAKRAIGRVVAMYGENLSEAVSREALSTNNFIEPPPCQATGSSAYSRFLGCNIGTIEAGLTSGLSLPVEPFLVFISLLPDAVEIFPPLSGEIRELREIPDIARRYRNVLTAELTLCLSVSRTPRNGDANERWIEFLRKELTRIQAITAQSPPSSKPQPAPDAALPLPHGSP